MILSTCPGPAPPPLPLCSPLWLPPAILTAFLTSTPGTSNSGSNTLHHDALCLAKYTQTCAGMSPSFPAAGILNATVAQPC